MKVEDFMNTFNLFSLGYVEIVVQKWDVARTEIIESESYWIGYFDHCSYRSMYNKWGKYEIIEAYFHKMLRSDSVFFIDVEEEE